MILEALQYDFFVRALVAVVLASIACGIVGSLVVVKKVSSISGGLAHAAFGGVGLGYLLDFDPLIGAAGFALVCALILGYAYLELRSGLDTLISIVWALGMALGIIFVSFKSGYAPDLMSYLFGSILFVPWKYVIIVGVLDVIVMLVVAAVFRPLQAVAFDENFARVTGVRVELLFLLMMALVALTVVTLVRLVGVILVIALLTIPATVARHWAEELRPMMILATGIALVCGVLGLYGSYGLGSAANVSLATGPLIIVIAVAVFGVSAVLRRARGHRA